MSSPVPQVDWNSFVRAAVGNEGTRRHVVKHYLRPSERSDPGEGIHRVMSAILFLLCFLSVLPHAGELRVSASFYLTAD
jgi:hypothetical protein